MTHNDSLDRERVQHLMMAALDGERFDGKGGVWNAFAFFSDPDGNGWVLQERPHPV